MHFNIDLIRTGLLPDISLKNNYSFILIILSAQLYIYNKHIEICSCIDVSQRRISGMTDAAHLSPLFTDLYQLTMGAAYFGNAVFSDATFSLFVRDCPSQRNYFVSASLEDVLKGISAFRFSADDLTYLKSTGLFSDPFLAY